LDPDPDPYWPPPSSSGSGSVKNEYGSTTLSATLIEIIAILLLSKINTENEKLGNLAGKKALLLLLYVPAQGALVVTAKGVNL
jgi:hypothetical protein